MKNLMSKIFYRTLINRFGIAFFFLLGAVELLAQGEFITVWNTNNSDNHNTIVFPGAGNNYTILVSPVSPTTGTAFTITGNGVTVVNVPVAGTWRLAASPGTGNFTNFNFVSDTTDRLKIITLEQWGSTVWSDLINAFRQCKNLNITATDVPNLSSITNLTGLFDQCTALTGNNHFNNWDVSNVVNMTNMFHTCSSFNQDIGDWNTSNVAIMTGMFVNAISFNQDIGSWNTSKVNIMAGMFSNAASFNQPIGLWNTGNVTNMNFMFAGARAFNQNIGNWSTDKVTTMQSMFSGAVNFNQPLNNWNTGNVTRMNGMFSYADAFNQPLNNWNTGKVLNMRSMFSNADSFNQALNGWNTENVVNMDLMFLNAINFNQPLNNWNTGNVTTMESMFAGARLFNQPLSSWKTSKVTSMRSMFSQAFNQNLGNWNLSALLTAEDMLSRSGLDCVNYTATLDGWGSNPVTPDNILLGASSRIYSSATGTGRSSLIAKGWTITDSAPDGGVCAAALPVIFNDFNAVIRNGKLVVTWTTLSEMNNDHFEVDMSKDGLNFVSLGSLVSKAKDGNSETIIEYAFSKTIYNTSFLGVPVLFLILALLVRNKRRKSPSVLLGVVGFVLMITGCTKGRYTLENEFDENVYVRIAQIDKDGLKTHSKIIKAKAE